jgi:WD40 repeat protein
MIRIRVFWAISIAIVWACAGFGQTGDVFTVPQSTLLFSPPGGTLNYGHRPLLFRPGYDDTNYGEYTVVTPGGKFSVALPQNSGSMGLVSPNWAISPSGDRVAGGISFMLNVNVVKCDPSKPTWCDPYPRPIIKNVLGVYSVRDKRWKQYGDFEMVGSAAFSPDGSRVAFLCDDGLTILDIATGQMTQVPGRGSKSIFWNAQISWSPDGKFLVGTVYIVGHEGQIGVINLATGEVKTIAEGSNPSWSPKGDWIAYAFTVHCMIVHPDGTGTRSVLEKEQKWMKYTLDGPILWSPDGERLLLNQRKISDSHPRVIMVDLATGHAVMKSKEGELVTGWVRNFGS